jgi:hypothetical protein
LVKGSGVLLNALGFIITAKHLFKDFDQSRQNIQVSLKSVSRSPVPGKKVKCAEDDIDLCLIRIDGAFVEAEGIKKFFRVGCGWLPVGTEVRAVGFPFGMPINDTPGEITGGLNDFLSYPMASVALPGMSGGPIVIDGDMLVGIVIAGAKGFSGLTFMTPLSAATELVMAGVAKCQEMPDLEAKTPPVVEPRAQPKIVDFHNDDSITLDELPRETFELGEPIASRQDLDRVFSAKPAVKLFGSNLVLGSASADQPGTGVTLYLSELDLTNSKIYLGSSRVTIVVRKFVARDSEVLAFPENFRVAEAAPGMPDIGVDGLPGRDGLSGGLLDIYVINEKRLDLAADLTGQDGGAGGQGGPGKPGERGSDGEDGSNALVECNEIDGAPGGVGGKGGTGGNGGSGGDGGYLRFFVLEGIETAQRDVQFTSLPGKGGSGGDGGLGGPGGAGGHSGFPKSSCLGASDGPVGQGGEAGAKGEKGQDGDPGRLVFEFVRLEQLRLPGLALQASR